MILIGLSSKQLQTLPQNIMGVQRTESIAELANYYSMADVYVNPTHKDNFPTTNIEALACGTPVITYNTGGSPEAIDDKTGKIIKKGMYKGCGMPYKNSLCNPKNIIQRFATSRRTAI